MDYLIGSIVTAALFIFGNKLFVKFAPKPVRVKTTYSQSSVYRVIGPIVRVLSLTKKLNTQASKHQDSMYVRVVLVDNKAYWISNNIFYVADEEDGIINKETTKPVDTISMDKVQLEKMIFIVETLTEGAKNEDRNSGNKEL